MIYVMSDIHGQTKKYKKMLKRISFSDNDTLYILGDIVDRGDGGIDILLDVMQRKNVVTLMGNHEWSMATLLSNDRLLTRKLGQEQTSSLYRVWFDDGGLETYQAFKELSDDMKRTVLDYIDSLSFIKEIDVNGNKYFLAHTVPRYDPEIPLTESPAEDFIHGIPDYNTRYFDEKTIVSGHIHTEIICNKSKGRIWKGNGHIAIDCGAVKGGRLGCICLDNMKEYYV